MSEIEEIQASINSLFNEISGLDDGLQYSIQMLMTRYGRLMFREGAKAFEEKSQLTMIGGVKTPPELVELIGVLYPEHQSPGSTYSLQVNKRRINMLSADYRLLLKKQELAISGAMRWEFSQEAPLWIHTRDGFHDYKTKPPHLNDMKD